MQLEFGLQVHFALWPLITHKDQHDKLDSLQRMAKFKNYLETRGAILVSHADFLPYYALPHVPEPENHPSFQHLLDPQCMAAQRSQLGAFLKALPDRCKQPRIYSLLTTDVSRAWSSRSADAKPDPTALLTGQETLDSFIGKSPVNMSFEQRPPSAVPAQSRRASGRDEDHLTVRASNTDSPVAHLNHDTHTGEPVGNSASPSMASSRTRAEGVSEESLTTDPEAMPGTSAGLARESAGKGHNSCIEDHASSLAGGETGDQPAMVSAVAASNDPALNNSPSGNHSASRQGSEKGQAVINSPGIATPVAGSKQDALKAVSSHDRPVRDRYSESARQPEPLDALKQDKPQTSSLTVDKSSYEGPFAEHTAVEQRYAQHGPTVRRSITRTAQEQAQLPPIAWDLVKRHLGSSDVALRAALLQVWPE